MRGCRRGSVASRAGAMDRADRLARSLELEKAYVHDTYQEMYQPSQRTKPWPKVTQFLHDLEPGSLVCDIGEYIMMLYYYNTPATPKINCAAKHLWSIIQTLLTATKFQIVYTWQWFFFVIDFSDQFRVYCTCNYIILRKLFHDII